MRGLNLNGLRWQKNFQEGRIREVGLDAPARERARKELQHLQYEVVATFSDYNEVLKGKIVHNALVGESAISVDGQVTGMHCDGKSWVTYLPPTGGCVGQEGKAQLFCSEGRIVDASWRALSCTSGYGVGKDQAGNELVFVYGMNEVEATAFVQQQLANATLRPQLPPPYKPKETRREKGFSVGTGFFVTNAGHLITNYHVVEDAQELTVILPDKTKVEAKLIRADPANDVAILKIDMETKALPVSRTVDLAKGEEVFTLGYPLVTIEGQEAKATFGRINALSGIQDDVRYLQMDVPIQPGNSGGPLIDRKGHVVGVTSATLDVVAALRSSGTLPQNVNYAINPTSRIRGVWSRKFLKIKPRFSKVCTTTSAREPQLQRS